MLKCNNICVKNILENVSFNARCGSFTAILGKNGSGKTTLAKCIMGEQKYSGNITLCGENMRNMPHKIRAKRIAYLPQSLPSPNVTVAELVEFGRAPYTALNKKLCDADIDAISKAIEFTKLTEFKERMLPTLSGGEKQRAFLAMLLAQETDILLLDEPTAYMDMSAAAEFTKLLKASQKTVIAIMHDISLSIKHADNVLILDEGKQIFFGSKDACLESEIAQKTFCVKNAIINGETIFYI